MFGQEADVPIVEVSIDSSSDPEDEWKIGQALDELRQVWPRNGVTVHSIDFVDCRRSEGILLLSGGLTIHNLGDLSCFQEQSAKVYSQFDNAVTRAVQILEVGNFDRLPPHPHDFTCGRL